MLNYSATEPMMDIEGKIGRAVGSIKTQLRAGKCINVATSFGKDSSVLANIALTALREVISEDGCAPMMLFTNSNTLLENPIMDAYSKREAAKIRTWVKTHKLPVQVDIVTPNLSNNYLVAILGGRTMAILADNDAKCSNMMKVAPITRHKNRVFAEHGKDNTLTLLGKRFEESSLRAQNMRERNENDLEPVRNELGEWILSPLAYFSLDDVFTYIGMVRGEMIECYSNFDDLVDIYRDANGGECMVNVYATGKSSATGCGARMGCHICLRVQDDKSMENMLQEERFAFMRPLNDLRNYLKSQHYNPAKRNWLARTVNRDGTINIAPNAYSPEFCRELLRIVLSIDYDEQQAAAAQGIAPRFELLRLQDIIAIDVMWNRYGYTKGLEAASIYRDVFIKGHQYPIPADYQSYPNNALPRISISVPFVDKHYDDFFNGMRDVEPAMVDVEQTITKKSGVYSTNRVADEFEIDPESATCFFEFDLEYALDKYNHDAISPVSGFHYLMRLGAVILYKGSHAEYDRMLKMANAIWRHDIRDVLHDPAALVEKLAGHTWDARHPQGDLFAVQMSA